MSLPTGSPSVRRVPAAVLAAMVAIVAAGLAWSVVLPLGEGPDEASHLGLVLHLADGGGYPDHDGLRRTAGVARLCASHAAAVRVCPRPGEEVTAAAVRRHEAADAPARSSRPAWSDDGGRTATAAANQMPQHPPLYYVVMAGFLRVARAAGGGELSLDRELALLRAANVALLAPLPLLAWLAARRSGADEVSAQVAGVAAVGLPMVTAVGSAVNNDNLLTVLGSAVTVLLVGVARGDRRRSTGWAVGALLAAALATKAFAVVFVPLVVLAYWLGRDRTAPSPARTVVAPLARAGGAAALLGGGWYLRTWVRAGSPTPSVDADRYTTALRPPSFDADPISFADRFIGAFAERFWGSFGWYSVRFPGGLTVGLSLAAAALVALGVAWSLRAGRRGRREPQLSGGGRGPRRVAGGGGGGPAIERRVLPVLLGPAVLLAGLTVARAWSLHARSGQYPFIQGRYLFAGVVGLLVVAAAGARGLSTGRHPAALVAATAFGAVALQGFATWRALTAYWGAPDAAPGQRLDALAAWSGWPDAVALAAVTGAAAAAVALLGVSVAVLLQERSEPVHDAPVPSASR